MTELNKFFIQPDNHLTNFSMTMTTIYQDYLVAQCAPTTLSHNAKYKMPKPQINHRSSPLCQDINEDEDTEEEDVIHDPSVYAARYGKQTPSEPNSSYSEYTPIRCKVCGLTQKECHQQWRTIHDPNDPDKCPFRGPHFIQDKQIRENVLQYNLKHSKNERGATKDITKTTDKFNPPGQPTIPDGNDKARDPSVGKMLGMPSIQSLIEFIENVEVSTNDNIHLPKVAMNSQFDVSPNAKDSTESKNDTTIVTSSIKNEPEPSTTDFFPNTSATIPPSKFYRIKE